MRNFNVTLENGNTVILTEHDLSNSGGEGEIFIKDGFAYKIFFDKSKAMKKDKIKELSILERKNIIRPIQCIYNDAKEVIGYQMNAVYPNKCFPLTRFITNDFREKNNISDKMVTELIKEVYETFSFIHEKGFLIVDGNEMNFLISDDFKEIFFIDVDSYKTPSFSPTAYNPTTLDPYSNKKDFNTGTDWYIFGILFCQIVLGIHPFKGKYTGVSKTFNKKDISKRMKLGVSVFNKKVKLNKAVRSLSLIPKEMKEWLESIFTTDRRTSPPLLSNHIVSLKKSVDGFDIPNGFNVFETLTLPKKISEIIKTTNGYFYKSDNVYFSDKDSALSKGTNLSFSVGNNLAFAKIENNDVLVFIPEMKLKNVIFKNVENIYVFNDELFFYKNNQIHSVELMITGNKIISAIKTSKDLYHHNVINNMLMFNQSGKRKALYFYEKENSAIIDMEKMVGAKEKIVDIIGYEKYIVLKVIEKNILKNKIFHINLFSKETTMLLEEESDNMINFVNKNGLLIGEISEDELVICNYNGSLKCNRIKDFNLGKKIFIYKDDISFINEDKLYSLSMSR